jgi:hypothetical protein
MPKDIEYEPSTAGKNGIKLTLFYPLPSINQILAMSPWHRIRERTLAQASVLFALRASAFDSSMSETSTTNMWLTHWSALNSYVTTRRSGAGSKSARFKSPTPS